MKVVRLVLVVFLICFFNVMAQKNFDIFDNIKGQELNPKIFSNSSSTVYKPCIANLEPAGNLYTYSTIIYTYSKTGLLIAEVSKNIKLGETYYLRNTYKYNESNLLIAKLSENLVNKYWTSTEQCTYIYNNNGNLHSELLQKWTEDNWENVSQIFYFYDNVGNLLDKDIEEWNEGVWVKKEHYNFVYDHNNNMISQSYQIFNGTWIYKWRYLYNYNNSDKLSEKIWSYWKNNLWVDSTRSTCTYNDLGKLSSQLNFGWNLTNGDWEEKNEDIFSYDSRGNLIYRINRYDYYTLHGWYRYNYDYAYSFDSNDNCISAECNSYYYQGTTEFYRLRNSPMYIYFNNNSEFLYLTAAKISVRYSPITSIMDSVKIPFFSAVTNGNNITLIWKTAVGIYNFGIEIERADSNNNFSTIGFIEAVNDNYISTEYSFTDYNLGNREYSYRLKIINHSGTQSYSQTVKVGVAFFYLSQNFPNPFNLSTTIKYAVPSSGNISLKVYNILGKEVAVLVNEYKYSGNYEINFNGVGLASGVYFYQLKSGNFTETKKLLLLK